MAKKSRNVDGRGTTYFNEQKDLWIHQVSFIDPGTGKAGRRKFANKIKKKAVQAGDEFKQRINQGVGRQSEHITVADWITDWLDVYMKNKVRAKTWEKYKSSLECYILPKFGPVKLADLKSFAVQDHFNALLATGGKKGTGISTSTVNATRRYFISCLDAAVKHGFLQKNILKDTSPAKQLTKEMIILTPEEINRLAENAKNLKNNFMAKVAPAVILLAARTGCRAGELFGLKWTDFYQEEKCMHIRRALSYTVANGYAFTDPKTKFSRRKILLTQKDVDLLLEYKNWQDEFKEKLGDKYEDQGLIFTNMWGKPFDTSNFTSRYFKPLLKETGLDERFSLHGLRHSHISHLLQQGVHPKIVQERAGHHSVAFTISVYGHLFPDMQKEAVEALDKIF